MTRFTPVHTGNSAFGKFSQTVWAVYPCVYREHVIIGWYLCIQIGLSLCVQGTSTRVRALVLSHRFIPVCTGNISQSWWFFSYFAVYPCVYREHYRFSVIKIIFSGLSLCVQGTLPHYHIKNNHLRFIPVCTGNIWWNTILRRQFAVYPCVYREHQ